MTHLPYKLVWIHSISQGNHFFINALTLGWINSWISWTKIQCWLMMKHSSGNKDDRHAYTSSQHLYLVITSLHQLFSLNIIIISHLFHFYTLNRSYSWFSSRSLATFCSKRVNKFGYATTHSTFSKLIFPIEPLLYSFDTFLIVGWIRMG
jgi:hypothetical protein